MSDPREFYLEYCAWTKPRWTVYEEKVDGLDENAIHVIEMTAYRELESEIAWLKTQICPPFDAYYKECEVHVGALEDENKDLKEKLAIAVQAIEALDIAGDPWGITEAALKKLK